MNALRRRLLLSAPIGAVLALATAWVPMFFLTEFTPAPGCSHAWRVDDNHIGTVLYDNLDWWLPVHRERTRIAQGTIVLRAQEDLGPPG